MTVEYKVTFPDGNVAISPVDLEATGTDEEFCPELSVGEQILQDQVSFCITGNTIDIRSLYGMING